MSRERFPLIAKRAGSFLLRLPNRGLDYLERFTASGSGDVLYQYPPIFIIGSPRSGSTLLYQTLVNRFAFGYLCNLHCWFYGAPSIVHPFIRKQWEQAPLVAYESVYGRSQGLLAPSECGDFWYRWFSIKPQYVALEDIDLQKFESLQAVLGALTRALQRPLLFKNLHCTLRLRPLAVLLPSAVFIVCHRETLWVAQSLLQSRQQIYGDIRHWWSVEPPGIEFLKTLLPTEQVVAQVHAIYDLIEQDRVAIGPERFLEVEYEAFCQDVLGTMHRIGDFLAQHGIRPTIRGPVPSSFPVLQTPLIAPEHLAELKEIIARYEARRG